MVPPLRGEEASDKRDLIVPFGLSGVRLDVALVRLVPKVTRASVQRLLKKGLVRLDGLCAKASTKLRGGERIEIEIPPPEPSGLVAQDLPISILFEDDDLMVLDKVAGMVVHPARGALHSTLVNALLHHLGEMTASGSRLGLVHRLDKDTSGCLVVAKTDEALGFLQAAFKARKVEKQYLALCHGSPAIQGQFDTPYGRHPRARTRFTSRVRSERRAVTSWRVLESYGGAASFLEVTLQTGRTHQIRVHLSEHGHPLLADSTYGGTERESRLREEHAVRAAAAAIGRQALHAARLVFEHPRSGERVGFEAPLPPDFRAALAILRERALPAQRRHPGGGSA